MIRAQKGLLKNWMLWIIAIIALTYAPFLGLRVVRMAGDEKVYVSQALEMAAHGNWFLQRIQEQPDYYKGPLHYLFLRVGLIVFGKSPWAALYMNFLLLIAGGISLGALIRRHCPNWRGGAIWAGAFFATCVGVYTHSFASQMETELACLFAIALWLLDRMEDSPGFAFWIVTGLIGWSKSPLHALLAGTAAVLYWMVSGQLWKRLKNWRCWSAVAVGIAVCVVGYLPAYLLDHGNFMDTYIARETFSKGDSGQHWSVSLFSVLGFYLLPWLLLCLVAYTEAIWNLVTGRFRNRPAEVRQALLMAVCWVTPSFVFFWYHPYHFENYNLPVISGVVLFISLIIGAPQEARPRGFRFAYRTATVLTASITLLVPVILTVLEIHFSPMPVWWPRWLLGFAWVSTLSSVIALIYYGWFDQLKKMHALAIGMVGFYLTLGSVISVIGERELVGLRDYLHQYDSTSQPVKRVGYYNLHHNIWSEWGYLNLWLDRPVYGIHESDDLKKALVQGETVIVPARGPLQDFKEFTRKQLPGVALEMTPWKRWRTQGKSESGEPLWLEAWRQKDLSVLETDYFIVRKK